jgi:hypothetical protein
MDAPLPRERSRRVEAQAMLAGILAIAAAPERRIIAAEPPPGPPGQDRRDLPPPPPGMRWVRQKTYGPSIADRIRALKTVDEVRAAVSALIQNSPGTAATRRKLHRIAEERIQALQLVSTSILGPESGRLIATPAEARKERR